MQGLTVKRAGLQCPGFESALSGKVNLQVVDGIPCARKVSGFFRKRGRAGRGARVRVRTKLIPLVG